MSSTETKAPNPLAFFMAFARSSIGAKILVALTGIALWLFVLQHMVMNLQVFIPEGMDKYWGESINHYAHNLKSMVPLVWGARIGLLVVFVVHIVLSMRLARLNAVARPDGYDGPARRKSTVMSRTMRLTGPLILAFVIFHLAHFTWGLVQPESFSKPDADGIPNVAQMMWDGFSVAWIVVVYLAGVLMLMAHLVHGSQSVWQSFGWRHPTWTPILRYAGWAIVAAIIAGNVAMPVVLFVWRMQVAGT